VECLNLDRFNVYKCILKGSACVSTYAYTPCASFQRFQIVPDGYDSRLRLMRSRRCYVVGAYRSFKVVGLRFFGVSLSIDLL
jgi:hypothetical protein